MSQPKFQEQAIQAKQIKPGMVIKLTMIQAWCCRDGKLVTYSSTLVIESDRQSKTEQLAELDQFFMDVQVLAIDKYDRGQNCPPMMRIAHCADQAQQHTIYLVPEETVTVIGSFPLDSKSAQKRNRSRDPIAGARRQ